MRLICGDLQYSGRPRNGIVTETSLRNGTSSLAVRYWCSKAVPAAIQLTTVQYLWLVLYANLLSTFWVHILEDIWINMEAWHLPTMGFDPIIHVNLSSYWLHMTYWRNVIKATVLTSVFWISVRRLTLCHINVWSANYESMAFMVKCYPGSKPSCCADNNSYFVMALSRNTPQLRQVFPKEQYWATSVPTAH